MKCRNWLLLASVLMAFGPARVRGSGLDPRGRIHIPIGIPDTVDTLKTFVEAEGNFSPGFGTYGIYFWVWDVTSQRLYAPTMDEVDCEHGLAPGGLLLPWSKWRAGQVEVKTELCQVQRPVAGFAPDNASAQGAAGVHVVGARVHLTNRGAAPAKALLYVALRSLGAAGGPVGNLAAAPSGRALLCDGRAAVVAAEPAADTIVLSADTIGQVAQGKIPWSGQKEAEANSAESDGSGALRFDEVLGPGETKTIGIICPVLPGRRAVRHRWDGTSAWAQFDLNRPNPEEGGILQPDPGLGFWERLRAEDLFQEAEAYWRDLAGRVRLRLPEKEWSEAWNAIVSHAAICLNEGAPDVAVVNYNVFNRDGVYLANIFQKAARSDLAELAVDYFLAHPFNGRVQPEADNPGQILWLLGEHWRFTRDRAWLDRVYRPAAKIAAMIEYYRTTPGPHWVWDASLDFGQSLPATRRKQLKPGACDGFHPEYTEAFDIAGLRAAAGLAQAAAERLEAAHWEALAEQFMDQYDHRFGSDLAKGYGSYAVLWPCRLYPLSTGPAWQQFKDKGAQKPEHWRYFPLATAHQGLLAGHREAGWKTVRTHLDHPQMRGWYAFDEGGPSGTGGWNHVRTRWKQGPNSVAMPHGWALAEFHLLMRDCILFEEEDRLILFGGLPPAWFLHPDGFSVHNMPSHHGKVSLDYHLNGRAGTLTFSGEARPAGGYLLRLPPSLRPEVHIDQEMPAPVIGTDFILPKEIRRVVIRMPD